jgi:hypothetical protein
MLEGWEIKGSYKRKFHNIRPVVKPRTRLEDVVWRDTSEILGIQGWKRQAEDREEWK